jgi:Zn-dependent protease
MNTRLELGRIAGIPIFLDMFFVLVIILFSSRWFTSGNADMMSIGLVIVVGLILSILLHELGHAFAARAFKIGVSHIDLTGLGGIAHFERSLPPSVIVRTIVFLAGPAFSWLATQAFSAGKPMLATPLGYLSSINMQLMIFNLLPAYPLDGGHTLDAWIGKLGGSDWALRIVGALGLAVAAFVGYLALPASFFMLLLAFFLAQTNWEAIQSAGRFRGRR